MAVDHDTPINLTAASGLVDIGSVPLPERNPTMDGLALLGPVDIHG